VPDWLAVGAGGFIGAIARHVLGGFVFRQNPQAAFPWGTFSVNLIGCLAIGILAGVVAKSGGFSEQMRLFLFVGLLGGFTTFSAFGLEAMLLVKRSEYSLAGTYMLGSLVLGLLLVVLGFYLGGGRSI